MYLAYSARYISDKEYCLVAKIDKKVATFALGTIKFFKERGFEDEEGHVYLSKNISKK